MIPAVFLSLIFVLLAPPFFVALVFLRAAFWDEPHAGGVLSWHPPFAGGETLRDWAAATAEQLARARLAAGPDGKAVIQLATELEEGAVKAILPDARPAERERVVPCSEGGAGEIGATAPEILAIAAYLRQTQSRRELGRIHDAAQENARQMLSRRRPAANAPSSCPLRGPGNFCLAYPVRPLHCRPLQAAVAKKRPESSVSRLEAGEWERSVSQGIEVGLARALRSAELDPGVYEFNGALARALEVPDAAERWVRGERVFEKCHVLQS